MMSASSRFMTWAQRRSRSRPERSTRAQRSAGVSVYNYGTASETYYVRMKIGAGYNASAQVSSHAVGTYAYVTFPTTWTATLRGSNAVTCSTELTADATPANDKKTGTVTVEVHDVGATAIKVPTGTIDSGATIVPACSLFNYGTSAETYLAMMTIGTRTDIALASGHAPGTWYDLPFASFTARDRGNQAMSCSTRLTTDMRRANEKVTGSVNVAVHDVGVVEIVAPAVQMGPANRPASEAA